MRKKYIIQVAAVLGASSLMLGCASSDGDGAATEAQYAHPNDPSTWLAEADTDWVEDVETATDGDVGIDIHWSGSLAAAPEAADAMSSGTSQIGILYPIYTPSQFPAWAWLSEYSFQSDARPVIGDMQAYAAALEVSLNSDMLLDEYRSQGIEPLLPMFEMNAGYHLVCTDPVTSLADAEGKTIRTPGGPWEREAGALGMSPTQMGVGEMYEALQRGVLDCSVNPLRDMLDFDLVEVATEITMDDEAGFTAFNAALGANRDWWDAQPEDVQEQMWGTMKDYSERFVAAGLGADFELREASQDQGVTIHEMDADMREALIGNQDERREAALESAPEGLEAESEELLEAYEDAMVKWEGIIADELGYSESVPGTWSEIIDSDFQVEDIDFEPFADRLWAEVLSEASPANR